MEVTHDPSKAKIHFNLGNTHYRLHEFEKALKEYREALRLNPDDKEAKFNFEVALQALQGKEGALKSPVDVQGGSEEKLQEQVTLILQQIQQSEFGRNPKGPPPPIPPQPEKSKEYKKDW